MVLTSSSVSRFFPTRALQRSIMSTPFRLLGRVGEVVEGFEIVKAVEAKGSASGTPGASIMIANCGVV